MPPLPPAPIPTKLYRLVHVDNLATLLGRGGLHAPNHTPADGLPYRTIHDAAVQAGRHIQPVPCGPRGNIHDYVPFYFGPLSVMLLKLRSGGVAGYTEGQTPLVYLVTTAQDIQAAARPFVFSNGHGLARFTNWFDDLARLSEVDWGIVGAQYWADTNEDNDRKRRKQAEFLVWQMLDWSLVREIAVINQAMKDRVEAILATFPTAMQRPVTIKSNWYY